MSDRTLLVSDPGRGYAALKDEIDRAVARVFESGRYILGPEVEAFEAEFAGYVGCRHAVAVGNGTDALRLALIACGVQPGDEVLTVANAGDPTPMAIWSVGALPRFVDVDPVTFNMAASAAADAMGGRVRAILPVHLYGQAADVAALSAVAASAGVPLIEDACQAHGAELGGARVGGFGAAGCFSFYPTKNLGGVGDGGMVVSNDPQIGARLRLLREYGWDRRNHSVLPGVNSRLDELQAAILRVKLRHLAALTERRRQIASRYDRAFAGLAGLRAPVEVAAGKHVYHLYVVRTGDRAALMAALETRGIASGLHYPVPAYRQEAWKGLLPERVPLPVTEVLCAEVVSLPLFPEMTDDEVDRVIEAVTDHFATVSV